MKLLQLLLICLCFAACNGGPDNKIHQVRSDHQFKEANSNFSYQAEAVLIKPTWGQAHQWADERGGGESLLDLLGILLILLGATLVYVHISDAQWWPEGLQKLVTGWQFGVAVFVLLLGGVAAWKGPEAYIKSNNDKWVPKSQVEHYGGDHKPIWDSLRSRCLIIGGPYECYKK